MSRWLPVSLAVACAFSVAAACSNSNPKKKPVGGGAGAYEGGVDGTGTGGTDAGPDVVDASQDVVDAQSEPEASPPLPPLFFSVSPGAMGQPGSGVAQQSSPQSAVYGTTTAATVPSAGGNTRVIASSDLGLDPLDDIDAISVKKPLPTHFFYYFSVNEANHYYVGSGVGVAASHYTQRGDVFLSDGIDYNFGEGQKGYNGLYSTGPSVGLGQQPTGAGDAGLDAGADAATDAATDADAGPPFLDDNLDALEIGVTPANAGTAYFSVDPGASGAAGSAVASTAPKERGCTIYSSDRNGQNHVVYSCAQIGLVPGDNVNALAVFDNGGVTRVYFSVDPTTVGATASDVNMQTQIQYNPYPSDIFYSDGDGTNHLAVDSVALGLNYGDDVDALAIVDDPRTPRYVPSGGCPLTPSPVDPVDGGVIYSSYIAGNISGNLELFYAESAAAGSQISVYNLATCNRVQGPSAGAYVDTGGGDLVPVPAGWSPGAPLTSLAVWKVSLNAMSMDFSRIDLETGQTLAAYTAPFNAYVYNEHTIYLPSQNKFAVITDTGIALMDVPAGNPGDAGVVTLPPLTFVDKYCYGVGQAFGSDPSGFIEQAFLPTAISAPFDTLDCRIRLDGYPEEPYRLWNQGSVGSYLTNGVVLPGQALYLFERQNNGIFVHSFAPPSAVDGGVNDAGGGG